MDMVFTLYIALTFAAGLLLIPAGIKLAQKAGFVDRPGGRKRHEVPVPPVGGLIIFPLFMLAALLLSPPPSYLWLFAGLSVLVITGGLDDRYHIRPRIKFFMHILAAFLVVVPGQAIVHNLGDLFGFGPFGLGAGSRVFTLVAAVLLINAVNLMDGLDGLAAGQGFIVLLWLCLAAVISGRGGVDLSYLLILMAGLAAFLAYNLRSPWRKKASIFLGDSGSMALGLALVWFTVQASQKPDISIAPIGVAWLLALPIYDTCGQFARRVSQGRHPFDADHHHFHHHFLYAGLTPARTTAVILTLVFIGGGIGVLGPVVGIPEYVLSYLWIVLLFAHIYMSMRPHRFRRLVRRLRRSGTAYQEDES